MAPSISNRLPFQVGAKNTAIHKKKMLIKLPAGTGKTVIALDVAAETQCARVLVICPAFLKLNWMYELRKWYPDHWRTLVIESGEDAIAAKVHPNLFAVVGYPFFEEGLPKRGRKKKTDALKIKRKKAMQLLSQQEWDIVICDESHYLRKWESGRTRNVILKVARTRKRLLFLTATPLVTSAADLHPTYAVMQPGKWGSYADFKEKFCVKVPDVFDPSGFKYIGTNPANAGELKKRARDFVFSAKKKDVLKQLPEKRVITVPLNLGEFKKFENVAEMLDRLGTEDEEEEVKTERERIGKAKIESVLELLETIPAKEQVVIFAHHRSVVKAITFKLKAEGHKTRAILGGMTEAKRMARVIAFTEGRIDRLVVSMAAGGLGLNLQTASIAVFAELPYSYAEFEQCSDRVHRIGSKKKVRIYKLVAVNSMDEDISRLIDTKEQATIAAGLEN